MSPTLWIVTCTEESAGPQCNTEHAFLVESDIPPTRDMLTELHHLSVGNCTNQTYPGCEDCGGSTITTFTVLPFSEESLHKLGLHGEITADVQVELYTTGLGDGYSIDRKTGEALALLPNRKVHHVKIVRLRRAN